MPTTANSTMQPLERCTIVTWEGIVDDDYGSAIKIPAAPDKCVQFFGTFGVGGSITLEGSNDPRVETDLANAVWFPLTDGQGNAIAKTAASGEQISENPRFIRPRVTAGDGDTLLTCIVCAKF